jgi:hypothetical protein
VGVVVPDDEDVVDPLLADVVPGVAAFVVAPGEFVNTPIEELP